MTTSTRRSSSISPISLRNRSCCAVGTCRTVVAKTPKISMRRGLTSFRARRRGLASALRGSLMVNAFSATMFGPFAALAGGGPGCGGQCVDRKARRLLGTFTHMSGLTHKFGPFAALAGGGPGCGGQCVDRLLRQPLSLDLNSLLGMRRARPRGCAPAR